MSHLSIHSIGVILYRNNKPDLFNQFLEDTLDKIEIISLSKEKYKDIGEVYNKYKLDFDDSYQFLILEENQMTVATLDTDFKAVEKIIGVQFL